MIGIILVGLLAQSPPPLVAAGPLQLGGVQPSHSRFSRLGFAALLGLGGSPVGPPSVHGRVGFRIGLFDRTAAGSGANLALALLAGGGRSSRSQSTLGLDLRVELVYLGNKVEALQPIGNLFFTTGVVLPTDGGRAMGLHVGGGLGLDLLFSGLIGDSSQLWSMVGSSRELGLVIGAVILIVTAPAIEARYTFRPDGSGFGSVVFGIGI